MPLSDYGADLYAGVMTKGISAPSSFYLALCISLPLAENDGTEIVEPSGGGYSRTLISTGADWSDPVDGFSYYTETISITPSANWGVIRAYALCSASTAGEVYMYDYLAAAVSAQSGSTILLPPNSLSIGMVV